MIKPRSLLTVLLLPVIIHAAETVHLTGREAEAIELATKVFKKQAKAQRIKRAIQSTAT